MKPRGGGAVVLDKPVAVAWLSLALVYSAVTVITYQHVTASDRTTTAVQNSSHTVVADTSTNDMRNAAHALQHHTFPLHVHDDTREIIQHPGAPYMTPGKFPADLNAHTLRVPMFFDRAYAASYGQFSSIRDYLGNFGSRLMTPEQAASIGSYDDAGRETIYASVASYRDPECAGTVTDLFDRARYPERIRVAIVEQRLPGDSVCTTPAVPCDQDATQALCRYAHLLDYFDMDAHFGVGPVFARHLAHRHYRGEYYAMQIDSHVSANPTQPTSQNVNFVSTYVFFASPNLLRRCDLRNIGIPTLSDNGNRPKMRVRPAHVCVCVCVCQTTIISHVFFFTVAILTAYPSDISGAIDPVTHESQHPSTCCQ